MIDKQQEIESIREQKEKAEDISNKFWDRLAIAANPGIGNNLGENLKIIGADGETHSICPVYKGQTYMAKSAYSVPWAIAYICLEKDKEKNTDKEEVTIDDVMIIGREECVSSTELYFLMLEGCRDVLAARKIIMSRGIKALAYGGWLIKDFQSLLYEELPELYEDE